MDVIDSLYKCSDLNNDEYTVLKERYLTYGQDIKLYGHLMGRSTIPEFRNTQRPPGEYYLPICYTDEYIIKLVQKPAWGGYIMTITLWDLLVIDIDTKNDIDPFRNIGEYYAILSIRSFLYQ